MHKAQMILSIVIKLLLFIRELFFASKKPSENETVENDSQGDSYNKISMQDALDRGIRENKIDLEISQLLKLGHKKEDIQTVLADRLEVVKQISVNKAHRQAAKIVARSTI